MSTPPSKETMAYIERSERAIKAASILLADGYYDFAASRAYYAAFYAASALLLYEGYEFHKHSAVISAIHKEFIKTGRIEVVHGKNLNWLFELRSIGDYGVTVHVPKEDTEKAITASTNFLEKIKSILLK
jgi:uncharacterized protein (UPF0332 family)